jgi:hypothetical protein
MRAAVLSGHLALMLVLGALLGCASTKGDIPDWFLNPPSDPSYLFAAGTATSRDMQVAVDNAKASASRDLAQQFEMRVGNLTKQFQEEVGAGEDSELLQQFTSATKIVTDKVLNGARVDQRKLSEEKGIHRAYVLMSLPVGAANQILMDQLKANQNLYTRFQASQAFEELQQELEAYRQEQEP